MDKWTDIIDRLLKDDHKRKHKSKPIQLTNVAAGTQKRLLDNLQNRKDQRLTGFDNIRNLSRESSPVPLTEAELKLRKRKDQLDRWKQEKQQRRQVAASVKKKPFLVGVVHAPMCFEPPPPVPRPQSATSGRVTRSQTAKNELAKQKLLTSQKSIKSFAPQNAVFHPPQLKMSTKLTFASVITKTRKSMEKTNSVKTAVIPKPSIFPKQTESMSFRSKPYVKPVNKPIVREVSSTKMTTRSNRLANVQSKIDTNIKTRTRDDVAIKGNKTANKLKKTEFITVQRKTSPKKDVVKTKRQCTPRRPIFMYNSSSDDKSASSISSSQESTVSQDATQIVNKITSEELNTPRNKVPKSESSSEEKLKSPKDVSMTPENEISPCVVRSRGKENARKEIKQKLDEGLIGDDMSSLDSVHHFRQQLDAEIIRMTEMCHTWDLVLDQNELPNSIQELVLAAVGQTRLLMSQKLQQFAGLVERCAAGERHADGGLVTTSDLHGFWDMLFIQVENVDMRFKELEALRQRGWLEEEPLQDKKKPAAVTKGPKKCDKSNNSAPSRLREVIAAARKAKQQQTEEPSLAPEPQKTFEGVFFSVRSPVRTPRPPAPGTPYPAARTPRSSDGGSLLRTVLSAEARKASASKKSASYAMLRASQISKNVEIEGVSPLEQTPKNLTPIDLKATPARSILKSVNTPKQSERKLTKTVLFDNYQDSDSEGQDLNVTADSQLNVTETIIKVNDLKINDETYTEVIDEPQNTDAVATSPINKDEDDQDLNITPDSQLNVTETLIKVNDLKINDETYTEDTDEPQNADDVTTSPVNKDEGDIINNEETSEVPTTNKERKSRSRKKTLERQAAFDVESENSNVAMTRRRRKSATEKPEPRDTPLKTHSKKPPRRSSTKSKALQEIEVNIHRNNDVDSKVTPNPVKSRRHRTVDDLDNDALKVTPRTSGRRKKRTNQEDEFAADTLKAVTPRRSTRIRETAAV